MNIVACGLALAQLFANGPDPSAAASRAPALATCQPDRSAGDAGEDTVVASGQTYTKTVNRRFEVEPTGKLVLDNRYGDIDYATWDRSEVRISVTIEVSAKSEARAQEVFDRISFDFAGAPRLVSARTQLDGQVGKWNWEQGDRYMIHYRVSAPTGFALDLTNLYGDVRLPELAREAKLKVRYGDLDASDVAGPLRLELAYGNARLGRLRDVEADVQYGELALRSARDLTLRSRYSEHRFGAVGTLDLESQYDEFVARSVRQLRNVGRYDDFRIDSAWSVDLETSYTDMRIGWLAEAANMRMRYGDAHIGGTAATVRDIDLDGEYTDMLVRLHPQATYQLSAQGRHAGMDLPRELRIVRRESAGSTRNVDGANADAPRARVVLAASYGSIRVE